MPAYSTTGNVTAIYVGDTETVWNAESPASSTASRQLALSEPIDGTGYQIISVEGNFSGTPGTFTINVQTADTDTANAYQNVPGNGTVTAVGGSGNYWSVGLQVKAKFVRLYMTAAPSNSVTTTARITR